MHISSNLTRFLPNLDRISTNYASYARGVIELRDRVILMVFMTLLYYDYGNYSLLETVV